MGIVVRGIVAVAALMVGTGCLFGGSKVKDDERPTCIAYIDCASATAPALLDGIISAFGSDGSCWDESTIEACEASCATGREQLDVGSDAPESCSANSGGERPDDCDILESASTYCDLGGLADLIEERGCDGLEPDERTCTADAIWNCGADVEAEVFLCAPTGPM